MVCVLWYAKCGSYLKQGFKAINNDSLQVKLKGLICIKWCRFNGDKWCADENSSVSD